MKHVLVVGGAGYVGSILVPTLLKRQYKVTVYDTFWFWDENINNYRANVSNDKNLTTILGDTRDSTLYKKLPKNFNAIINLACLSNDPSSDIDYNFTHDVSYNGVMNLIEYAKQQQILFIQTSSSSVYGSTDVLKVTEELSLRPLTQYSQIKAEIDHYLMWLYQRDKIKPIILRPSTVCGYSPRQRLDLVVNIFTKQAVCDQSIIVYGGQQYRPGLHIKDMVNAYITCLNNKEKAIGQIYNIGKENFTVFELANNIQQLVWNLGYTCYIHHHTSTKDNRSYRLCSNKIEKHLGFKYKYDVMTAIQDLINAFRKQKVVINNNCYNIQVIKELLK